MDKAHKILAIIGTLGVAVLPVLAETTYAARPGMHLGLEIAAAILGTLGFTLAKPLFGQAVVQK